MTGIRKKDERVQADKKKWLIRPAHTLKRGLAGYTGGQLLFEKDGHRFLS
jgi:hypothetical protein